MQRSNIRPKLFGLVLLSAPVWAQPASESPVLREGIKAAVEVRVMDLDVVATAGGRPVTDLRKDELSVKVDGKTLPLDYFVKVESGTLHGPDLATASPDL